MTEFKRLEQTYKTILKIQKFLIENGNYVEYEKLLDKILFCFKTIIRNFPNIHERSYLVSLLEQSLNDVGILYQYSEIIDDIMEIESHLKDIIKSKNNFLNSDIIVQLKNLKISKLNMFETIENSDKEEGSFVYYNEIQLIINNFKK